MTNCPDENTLLKLATGQAGDELTALETHLDGCERCRKALAAAASEHTLPTAVRPAHLAPGRRVNRYEIERELGRGGMGTVYQARDVTLDRRVAVKLLHARGDDESQARLLREAQVMAKLAHPNVVPVFELGDWQGEVYLVMELVTGVTLEAWLKRARHSRKEVMRAFLQAGRGLAAAHAAGVVHRDFKPANVLVGADERVRVTDFGLSRPGRALELPPTDSAVVTRDGAIVGTLAYMAPEQLDGKLADERSDQFSFCVSLVEALAGHRPFEGERWVDLSQSLSRVPNLSGVPRALRGPLTRGLAREPARRYSSMTALLTALERATTLGWKEVAVTGVLAAAVVLGLTFKDHLRPAPAANYRTVVCAAYDMPEGAVVRMDWLMQRQLPADVLPSDVVPPDSVQYLIGQKLNFGVHQGEPLQWVAFERAFPATPTSSHREPVEMTSAREGLTKVDVLNTLVERKDALARCSQLGAHGTYVARFDIEPGGLTRAVRIDTKDGTVAQPDATTCLEDFFRQVRFPASRRGNVEPIEFPVKM